ncbi:hypothetical protein JCM19314_3068 [Nonlabens ulvanivorans]|uniref:DUF4286 domain-containing protein n=1 Tax=Nonlabens ulvanivorans TaxID=906888 RepID=A0A090QA12_NONUL|nr:DUF4286 family protein [Nonlabens ulvanivorans]GAK99037.1 hypothetical protein JCM19314_3068 [Nonlabens ulvanivorans]
MVIYNVTCNMASHLEEEWLEWIREHIAHVLGTGLFKNAKLTRVLVEEQDGASTFSIQYKAISRETLETYYSNHAEALRKAGLDKWGGNNVLSFRTELDVLDEYTVHTNLN